MHASHWVTMDTCTMGDNEMERGRTHSSPSEGLVPKRRAFLQAEQHTTNRSSECGYVCTERDYSHPNTLVNSRVLAKAGRISRLPWPTSRTSQMNDHYLNYLGHKGLSVLTARRGLGKALVLAQLDHKPSTTPNTMARSAVIICHAVIVLSNLTCHASSCSTGHKVSLIPTDRRDVNRLSSFRNQQELRNWTCNISGALGQNGL